MHDHLNTACHKKKQQHQKMEERRRYERLAATSWWQTFMTLPARNSSDYQKDGVAMSLIPSLQYPEIEERHHHKMLSPLPLPLPLSPSLSHLYPVFHFFSSLKSTK